MHLAGCCKFAWGIRSSTGEIRHIKSIIFAHSFIFTHVRAHRCYLERGCIFTLLMEEVK